MSRKASKIIEPIDMSIEEMSMAMLGITNKKDEYPHKDKLNQLYRKLVDVSLKTQEIKLEAQEIKTEIIEMLIKENNMTKEEAEIYIEKRLKEIE